MANSSCGLKYFLVRVGEISEEDALWYGDRAEDIDLARKHLPARYGEEPDRKVNIPIYTSGEIWDAKYRQPRFGH